MPKKEASTELKELKAIRRELRTIREEINKNLHPTFKKHALFTLGTGITKGVGFVIGTTIVATIVLFFLQWILGVAGIRGLL